MIHATRCSAGSCNGSSLYFKLMADFDWGSAPTQLSGFKANLDGNQYLIQGYGVSGGTVPAVNPLFSTAAAATTLSSSTLKNLNLIHSSIIYSGTNNGLGMLYSALNGSGFTFSDVYLSGMMDLAGTPTGNARTGFVFGYTNTAFTSNVSMDHVMTAGTFSTHFTGNQQGAGGFYSNHLSGSGSALSITSSYNTLNLLFNSSGSTYGTGGILGQYDLSTSAVTAGSLTLDKIYVTGYLWNGGATTNPGIGGIVGVVATQSAAIPILSSSDYLTNTLSNLSFSGSLSANQSYIGGIVGKLSVTSGGQSITLKGNSTSGSISNSFATGQYVGGQFGQIKNNTVSTDSRLYLSDSIAENSVTQGGTGVTSYVGGLAGSIEVGNSTIASNHTFEMSNTLATGPVSLSTTVVGATGTLYAGGLVGYLYWSPTTASGVFSKNGATGNLTCSSAYYCGGLAGLLSGAASDAADTHLVDTSYATGSLTSSGTTTGYNYSTDHGGFVGLVRNGVKIQKSFATGSWSDTAGGLSGYGTGGFAGELGSNTTLAKCFSTGSITANTATGQIGGLVGRIQQSTLSNTATITQSWATGSISATSALVNAGSGIGGLIGYISGGTVTVDRSFAAGTSLDANPSGDSRASGFIGTVTSSNSAALEVKNSYSSIGTITGNNSKGFLNTVTTMGVCFYNSYYLTTGTVGASSTIGSGTANGTTCSTTSATQVSSTVLRNPASSIFSSSGWDYSGGLNFSSATPSWTSPTNGGSCSAYTCPSSSYFYPTIYW
jgi:hypothetical protein